MTNLFRLYLFWAVKSFYLEIAKIIFPSAKKNPKKFNFFEISAIYYNVDIREFALKAKSFSFGKKIGEGNAYSMKKTTVLLYVFFLLGAFCSWAQDNFASQLEKYSQALKSEKAKDRLEAIYALSSMSQAQSEKMLMDAYNLEKDSYLKTQILEALSVRNSTSAFAFIVKATEDSNIEIRKTAWNSLGEQVVSMPDIVIKVRENFRKEKNTSVKTSALRVLCLDTSTDTLKEISSFIVNSKEDKWLRKRALEKLSTIKTKATKKELYNISKSKDKEIAFEAAKLLGKK